ncbi:unnamed protein product [Caenorhabditis nigoni]
MNQCMSGRTDRKSIKQTNGGERAARRPTERFMIGRRRPGGMAEFKWQRRQGQVCSSAARRQGQVCSWAPLGPMWARRALNKETKDLDTPDDTKHKCLTD